MRIKTAGPCLAYNNHMSAETPVLSRRELKDLKILALFTTTYCRVHHAGPRAPLAPDQAALQRLPLRNYPVCRECAAFLHYAFARRLRCPLDEKPACKHCPVHCYKPGHREQVREIMRFSGRHLVRRGRLDLLWHYLF